MDFLNKNILLLISFILVSCSGCNSENNKKIVHIQVLSKSNQKPISDIQVTVLQKTTLLSFNKSRKVLISKTDSLGFFTFIGNKKSTYSLWFKNEKNGDFAIESLILNNHIVNDTITYDINMK